METNYIEISWKKLGKDPSKFQEGFQTPYMKWITVIRGLKGISSTRVSCPLTEKTINDVIVNTRRGGVNSPGEFM